MKFVALILVSFCVAQTFATPDGAYETSDLRFMLETTPQEQLNLPKFLEQLRQIAAHLEKRVHTELTEFHQVVEQLYTEALAYIDKVLPQADQFLEKLILAAINHIESLVDDRVHECVAGKREVLQEIYKNARAALGQCVTETKSKFEALKSDVTTQILGILSEADEIKTILEKCSHEENILEQVKCVLGSIDEIRQIVTKLVFGVKDALVKTSGDLHQINSSLKECFAKVLAQVRVEVRAVVADVVECVEHGPQTTTTAEPATTEEATTDVEYETTAGSLQIIPL